MKYNQKGFLGLIVGIVVVLILTVGTYMYFEKKDGNSSTTETRQLLDNKQNTIPKSDDNMSAKNTGNSVSVNGKCGLTISSPVPNEKFTWPLVIKGKVGVQQVNSECSWQTFEGVSGAAQLYFNENNKGWKSVGNSVIFGPDLSVTFNYTEIGLPINTPIKVVLTEENPAVTRSSLVFELPLILK